MATNPVRAAWDYLRGEDLKVRTPAATQDSGVAPELKTIMYMFSPQVYDSGTMSNTLGQIWGGRTLDGNSAVYACLACIANASLEARLRVFQKRDDGDEEWLDTNPAQKLFDQPNPNLTRTQLMWWVQYVKRVHGNAYLRKIRSGARAPVQLWPLSPLKLWPVTTDEDRRAGVFISAYRHDLGNGKTEDLPVADILHFRMGVDDRDHRVGKAPLQTLLREVATDEEANRFTEALLKNFAVPGLVVQIPAGVPFTEEQAKELKGRIQTAYGTDGRGSVGVLTAGSTMAPVGFSPQQLDLKGLHRLPEERIAAVFGVAAMVVGLGAGLDRSTFSNYREAREALFEETVLPSYQDDAAVYEMHLLRPDFTTDPTISVRYDITDVRSLQPDLNEVYARLTEGVKAGWITPDEARSEVGLPPMPDGIGEASPMLALPPPGQDDGQDDQVPSQRMRRLLAARKALGLGAFPDMLDFLHDMTMPATTRDFESYFDGQRERVLKGLRRRG